MASITINISIEVAEDGIEEFERRFGSLEAGISRLIESEEVSGSGDRAIDISAWEISNPRVEAEVAS